MQLIKAFSKVTVIIDWLIIYHTVSLMLIMSGQASTEVSESKEGTGIGQHFSYFKGE